MLGGEGVAAREQAIPEHKQTAQGQWIGCTSSLSSASDSCTALHMHSSGT